MCHDAGHREHSVKLGREARIGHSTCIGAGTVIEDGAEVSSAQLVKTHMNLSVISCLYAQLPCPLRGLLAGFIFISMWRALTT